MLIERAEIATSEFVQAYQRLLPQLTANKQAASQAELDLLLRNPASYVLIVWEPDRSGAIIGMGCLATYLVPTGKRAVIEDVVVDEKYRHSGIGESLVRKLMDLARSEGAPGVSLTSNPRRVAANRLYVRLGFKLRSTNAYYYVFTIVLVMLLAFQR
jgi:ribosomal protein S18 acetylase RimI-like enzyme